MTITVQITFAGAIVLAIALFLIRAAWWLVRTVLQEIVALEVPHWVDRMCLRIAALGVLLLPTEEARRERIEEFAGLLAGTDDFTPLRKLWFARGVISYGAKSAEWPELWGRLTARRRALGEKPNSVVRMAARGVAKHTISMFAAFSIVAGAVGSGIAIVLRDAGSADALKVLTEALAFVAIPFGVLMATMVSFLRRRRRNETQLRTSAVIDQLMKRVYGGQSSIGVRALPLTDPSLEWDIVAGLSPEGRAVYGALNEAWMREEEIAFECGIDGDALKAALCELRDYLHHQRVDGINSWARTPPLH